MIMPNANRKLSPGALKLTSSVVRLAPFKPINFLCP